MRRDYKDYKSNPLKPILQKVAGYKEGIRDYKRL